MPRRGNRRTTGVVTSSFTYVQDTPLQSSYTIQVVLDGGVGTVTGQTVSRKLTRNNGTNKHSIKH